jgi:hypothetical protein
MVPIKNPAALAGANRVRKSFILATNGLENNPQEDLVLQSILRRYGLPRPLAFLVAALVEIGRRLPV